MLYEWQGIRQRPEEGFRTWYTDDEMDLIVWRSSSGGPVTGFQLCYDKESDEKAISWHSDGRVSHTRIDAGEGRPGTFKASPVLGEDVDLDRAFVSEAFAERSLGIDKKVRQLVLDVLEGQSSPDGSS